MEILIDLRERSEDLLYHFKTLALEKSFDFKQQMLVVGDVVCGNVVIERKEASDFVSSIFDGRLKEQAAKMSMNFQHKYVIIEGDPFHSGSDISDHAIIGKMTSLLVKNDIRLLVVNNTEQFVYACYSLITKHQEAKNFCADDFEKVLFKIDGEAILTAMLFQIPGLGIDKSKQIAQLYNNSLKAFVNTATENELIKIDGIGKKTAQKVLSFLK